MRRTLLAAFALAGFVTAGSAIPARPQDAPITGQTNGAELVSAADVQYPFQTVADGVAVFDVHLNPDGAIAAIDTVRAIPSLTSAAESSLQGWYFDPAARDGCPEGSDMTVTFVFRHAVKMWNPEPFQPVVRKPRVTSSPLESRAKSGYVPPGILSIAYAEYPASTIAAGAVVVEVSVDENGKVAAVKPVRQMEGFTDLAYDAAWQWRFQPATLDGKPVAANVAIAFVFSSRALNPF